MNYADILSCRRGGFSYSGSASGAMKIVKQILTTLFGSPSYTNLDYTAIKPDYPFNWEELRTPW